VAVRASDGEMPWKTRLGGPVLGGVLVGDSLVYAATGRPDGKLYAVRRRDGNLRWKVTTGRTMVPLAASGTLVLAHTEQGVLVAVDGRRGNVAWRARVRPGRAAPVEAGGAIVATGIDSIYRIDPASGRVLLRKALPGAVLGGWTLADGRLVGGTADSLV